MGRTDLFGNVPMLAAWLSSASSVDCTGSTGVDVEDCGAAAGGFGCNGGVGVVTIVVGGD